MTLNQDELTEALHDALKACTPPCGRLCVTGATVADGRYEVFHNGAGSVKGDHQTVVAEGALKLTKEAFSGRLKAWLDGQHRREHVDLNAAMTSGPAMKGWPWRIQVTDCVTSKERDR